MSVEGVAHYSRASWLEDNGVLYKPGGVVILSMKTDPSFGLIKKISVT